MTLAVLYPPVARVYADSARLAIEEQRNAGLGAYIQHQLVRIYLLVGELEKALDQLEPLLEMPCYLSPGWLRIDPTAAQHRAGGGTGARWWRSTRWRWWGRANQLH